MASKITERIGNAFEKAILSRVKNNSLFAEYYNRSDGKKAQYKRQATLYDAQEIINWKRGVMAATDPDNPRRGILMRFYKSLMLDNHTASVIDTRNLRVQRSSYKLVNEKGVENENLKVLLERPWHDQLKYLALFSKYQGPTLIEMFDTDENGELARVKEIPQSNFIPQKGIIINEEYDDNGDSYIDGIYKDYYLQVGDDWDLGMLNQLAMIVLAKKLGLGSWMSYIDKFGVPPVFAITERMDTGRRDELFEMLENFRSNHFAVLQGKETITIPNNYNSDAYQSFKSLINDVCNREISKRVLGGSSTTDEKSFVGSAEVQERLTQDRYESDKLFYSYLFNTQIRQRLVKLSSVYADLATHTLVWDNQETLDITGYIDAIEKLSTAFDFDIAEVRTRTGLPIIGAKAATTTTPPDNSGGQKKKPDAILKGLAPYAQLKPAFVIYAATWDAAIERLANQIYSGEVKPADLDKDLVLKNYAAFNKEAEKAYGEGYYNSDLTRSFRENFLKFAGAKSHALMTDIAAIDARSGVSKESFITQAKSIVTKHNEQWLTTELRYCNSSVASARDYATYLEDEDIYPNLKYRTMADSDVRDNHAVNEGIVKPVREWTSIPPSDHGCRCWLEQTTDEPTTGRKLQGIKFHNNPHQSGEVFTQEQSYFKAIPDNKKGIIRDNTEQMKAFMPYNRIIKAGENTVFVNDFADLADVNASVIAAKKVAKELNQDVYVRPHIDNSDKLHVKNPEIGLGKPNNLSDLKTLDTSKSLSTLSFIKNAVYSANKQQCSSVIIDLSKAPEANYLPLAARKLRGDLSDKSKMNKGIKQVIIIHDDQVLKVTRQQINSKKFMEYFKFE
jgi:hypothetical protein